MDAEYIESLIKDAVEKFADGLDIEDFEHLLRSIITKIILHSQDFGVGEP